MKLVSKVIMVTLVLGICSLAFIQINKGTPSMTISKEHKQALIEQKIAKSKREQVNKKSYDSYQVYLNTFIGTNVNEIETELTQEGWKQESNKFISSNNDIITIETDKYDTIISVKLQVHQITKIYNTKKQ